MNKDELNGIVVGAIAKQIGKLVDNIALESRLVEELGVTSLDMLYIIEEIETVLGADIDIYSVEGIETVRDFLGFIEQKIG